MKLLLTSMGVTNKSIAKALVELVHLDPKKIKIGFIPTSANQIDGEKYWFLRQINNLLDLGFEWIDIIDFSADDLDWKQRLAEVNVIFVSGGNTYHLLNQMRKHGFDKWLKENINKYVYVGSSAGSIVLSPNIKTATIEPADENKCGVKDLSGLNVVDFEVAPHSWGDVTHESSVTYAQNSPYTVYELDDESAVQVNGDKISVVTEGLFEIHQK